MQVHAILFDLDPRHVFEGVPRHVPNVVGGRLMSLGFNVSPAAELSPALGAFGDGVVGVVVGHLKNGTRAIWALESDL